MNTVSAGKAAVDFSLQLCLSPVLLIVLIVLQRFCCPLIDSLDSVLVVVTACLLRVGKKCKKVYECVDKITKL